jgi:hypothetical protein
MDLISKYTGKKLTERLELEIEKKQYSLSKNRALSMYNRLRDYMVKNNKVPNCIYINQPNNSSGKVEPTNEIINTLNDKLGEFSNFTEFVEQYRKYAKNKGGLYGYYLNSKWIGTKEELKAVSNGWLLNCVDISQLGYAVAKLLGYNVRFVQYQCTNVTHLCIQVQGKKDFIEWKTVDLAAIGDANSKYYKIGEHWCSNTIVALDPAWMFEKELIQKI